MSKRIRKFEPGPPIVSITHLDDVMSLGGWIFYRHKAMDPAFVASMPYRHVRAAITNGWLRQAGVRSEWWDAHFQKDVAE